MLAPTRAAANELALAAFERGCQGIHALTITQLAAQLAARSLAQKKLAPISHLGVEALANRIVHAAKNANELHYFAPVAQTPGFPRAAARTIAELRLELVETSDLAATGPPGSDLARLMKRYERELEERSIADLSMLLRFAVEEIAGESHRFAGLPLVLLGLAIESRSHEKLLAALAEKSPDDSRGCHYRRRSRDSGSRAHRRRRRPRISMHRSRARHSIASERGYSRPTSHLKRRPMRTCFSRRQARVWNVSKLPGESGGLPNKALRSIASPSCFAM